MTEKRRNIAASVHARLLNLSREHMEDFNLTLQRYTAERFLFRLGESQHREKFALKGAMLYVLWGAEAYRATRDLDLLGYHAKDSTTVANCFREICTLDVQNDGLVFHPESLRAEEIRDAAEYGGVRVKIQARLDAARVTLQVDVGFGNAVVPEAKKVEYPTLLDPPAPQILAYPQEAVVAEKLHAMVILGEANSRMRDFYDLVVFAERFPFDGPLLARAVAATFSRRRTELPASLPPSLAPGFFENPTRAAQWRAYLDRNRLDGAPRDFTAVGEALRAFLRPLLEALAGDQDFDARWEPGGPWR